MSFCSVSTDSPQTVQNPPVTSAYTPPAPSGAPADNIPPRSDDTCGVYVPPTPEPGEGDILTFMAVADRILVEKNSVITFNVGSGNNTASNTPDYVQSVALDGTITKLAYKTFKIISDTSANVPTAQGVVSKSADTEGEYAFTPATDFVGTVDNWTYTATDTGTTGVADSDAIVSIRVVDTGALSNQKGLSWQGEWEAGKEYHDGMTSTYPNRDVVKLADTGALFVCIQSHTSDYGTEPQHSTTSTPTPWPGVWEMMIEDTNTAGVVTPQQNLLESLYNGTLDWMKNATVGDWIKAVAVGVGLAVAGNAIIDAFTDDGSSSTNQDTRYYGSPSYTGTYTPPSLRTVVQSLCHEAGIESFDVSLLPSDVACHFALSSVTTVRNVLDNLSKAFQFDMVDSSGTLKFVPRNSSVVRSLTHDDMGFNSSNDNVSPITMKRLQSVDLPRKVSLTYIAEDLDYNNYTQSSEIPTFAAGNDVDLTVPFMLTHADAKEACDKLLIGAHLERMQYTFKTSYRNAIDLEPGDIISIPEGIVRIAQIEEGDEGILEIQAVDAGATGEPQPIVVGGVTIGYTASTYVGTNSAPQLPDTVNNSAPVITKSGSMWFDPPVQSSTDTSPRVYAAVHGYGVDGWTGAQIYMSRDGGGSYSIVGQTRTSATWGLVETAIPAAQWNYWDDVTQITVKVKTGKLVSKTNAAVLAGENLIMVGQECIAFGVATLVDVNTYTLSHLLRGRRGTEWAVGSHVANEFFALIDTAVPITFTESDKGKIFLFKTVTIGSDLTKVEAESVQIMGENLIPWQPCALKVDQVNAEWFITWKERPRFANQLKDYSDNLHDDDFGGYALTIYNGDTKVRQTIIYDTTFVYTLAMQISDFGVQQTSVKVGINQISNKYGGSRQLLNT